MNIIGKSAMFAVAAAIAVTGIGWSSESGGLVSRAEARVGRPLTPVSYAGVARRTTRRTVAVSAAASSTAVVVATPQYATECVQVVTSSGASVMRCP